MTHESKRLTPQLRIAIREEARGRGAAVNSGLTSFWHFGDAGIPSVSSMWSQQHLSVAWPESVYYNFQSKVSSGRGRTRSNLSKPFTLFHIEPADRKSRRSKVSWAWSG